MISSGGAVVDGTRASHVAPALSFPPHHPLYPNTVPEFLRPPLPPRYRHPAGGVGTGTGSASITSAPPIVPVSAVTSPLAVAARTTLTKDEDDYSSYRLYPYPYPYPPYLYPLVRPLDFSYTSPPQSPLVNPQSANITRTGKTVQIQPPPPPSLPPPPTISASSANTLASSNTLSSNTRNSSNNSLPPPPPPPLSSSSSLLLSSSSSSSLLTTSTIGAAKEPLKSRLLRKRSRAGPSTSFARGSLIRLASGELRRVEEMRTEDFITSAQSCPALRLDPSTVVRIDSPPDSPTAVLTLSYGQNRSQTEVECTADHPYFVYGQGWASCRPERTLASYGLKVHQLQVGDVCISLTPRVGNTTGTSSSAPPSTTGPIAAHSGLPLLDRKRRWSAPDEIHELPPPAHQQPPPVKD